MPDWQDRIVADPSVLVGKPGGRLVGPGEPVKL